MNKYGFKTFFLCGFKTMFFYRVVEEALKGLIRGTGARRRRAAKTMRREWPQEIDKGVPYRRRILMKELLPRSLSL